MFLLFNNQFKSKIMEKYISTLENNVLQSILEIEGMECSTLQKSKLIVFRLEEAYMDLKHFISEYSFRNEEEEIRFFKEIKPRFFSRLIYYSKIHNIEMWMPTGSMNDKRKHLERIQECIKNFFDNNLDLYGYYRSGNTHLDHLYFLRGKQDVQLPIDSINFERDNRFSTSCDLRISKILANENLEIYLNSRLAGLTQEESNNESIHGIRSNEKWTDTKNALGEIIYGIDTLASINHGNIDIITLAEMFGKMFNVDMSNIYQIYIELKGKKDRTEYLNRMIKALLKRMDNDDNK